MAGPSSHTSVMDIEALAESYIGTRSAPEGTRTHRSSRWEWPTSSGSSLRDSDLSDHFEDNRKIIDADDGVSSNLVLSTDLLSHQRDPHSPSWSELAREVEDVLKDEESPLTGYSYEDIGVPGMGGEPFVGDDWAEMIEEESLQARVLKFNSPDFVRDFFEGKQRDSIAVRRGIANPPTIQIVSPIQSPVFSSVQSSTSSTLSSGFQSSIESRPFVRPDWAEVVNEENLRTQGLKFTNPNFVRDFFEGKTRDRLATRRGIANPPTLQAVSPIQSPVLSPVQSSGSSPGAPNSTTLSWPFPSPTSATSRPLQSPAHSPAFESPRLCQSPEHASFGDGPYTQNLLMQVTGQLTRLMDALEAQQEEIEKLHTEPVVSSQYFRQQLLAFNKRLIALEEEKEAREEASQKNEHTRQKSIRFGAEAFSKSAKPVEKQHRVYPKEKWPSARDIKVSAETSHAKKRVAFGRHGSQTMTHAAAERFDDPKKHHPRVMHSPTNASSNKKKSVAHPLSRAAQSEKADGSRLKARPTVAAKVVTVVGKAAITVMAAVYFHGMVHRLC